MNVFPWLVVCSFIGLLFTKGVKNELTKLSGVATGVYLSLRLFFFLALRDTAATIEDMNLLFAFIVGCYFLFLLIRELQFRDMD